MLVDSLETCQSNYGEEVGPEFADLLDFANNFYQLALEV